MAEKVKVSREVAEAIESAKSIRSEETIVNMSISKSFVGDQESLNNLNPYLIAKILINGYEIKQTPEEIIREKFEKFDDYTPEEREHKFTILFVLDTLGIKIKGVNEYEKGNR